MNSIFVTVYFFTLFYVVLWKQKFDISFFVMCGNLIYLYPGVVGVYPRFSSPGKVDIISENTYLILTVILVLPFLLNAFPKKRYISTFKLNLDSVKKPSYTVAIVLFILNLATLDVSEGLDKRSLMESMTIFYNLWVYLSIIAIVLNGNNSFRVFILLILLSCDVFYYSMRIHFIFGIYALLVVRLLNKDIRRNLPNILLLGLGTMLSSLFLIFKSLIIPLRSGDWQLVFERISSSETYLYWIVRAEPFNQVAIIDKVVESNFRAPASHVLGSFLVIVPYWNKIISLPIRFHDYFHAELFPTIPIVGSIANSPWAQAYAVGLLPGFLILCSVYLGVLVVLRYLSYGNENAYILVALLLFPIAFYWHRNDLYFTLNIIKRILFGLIFLIIVVGLLKSKYVRDLSN
jgi:hypothetical protein